MCAFSHSSYIIPRQREPITHNWVPQFFYFNWIFSQQINWLEVKYIIYNLYKYMMYIYRFCDCNPWHASIISHSNYTDTILCFRVCDVFYLNQTFLIITNLTKVWFKMQRIYFLIFSISQRRDPHPFLLFNFFADNHVIRLHTGCFLLEIST